MIDIFKSWPIDLTRKFAEQIAFMVNPPASFSEAWQKFILPRIVATPPEGTQTAIGNPPQLYRVQNTFTPWPPYWGLTVFFDSRIFTRMDFDITRHSSLTGFFFKDYTIRPQAKELTNTEKFIYLVENQALETTPQQLETAREFRIYYNSFLNYGSQIQSEKNLLQNQASVTLNNFRQDYADRANREAADLQAKKLQILIAIDNEAKSAQRDFQYMLLSAENLKQKIGVSIG